MNIKVLPGVIHGSITVPGSKSVTQRYILLSAFMNKEISIRNPSGCEDEEIAIAAAEKCGSFVFKETDRILVQPNFKCPDFLFGGESGTSSRLLMGLLAGSGCKTHLKLSDQLMARPFDELIDFLRHNSIKIEKMSDGYLIDGTERSFQYRSVRADKSSQFVSSALLYLALGGMQEFELTLRGSIVSSGYLDLTLSCLPYFGYFGLVRGDSVKVFHKQIRGSGEVVAEGDYSSAAFWIVLSLLASQNDFLLKGLSLGSRQPDSAIIDFMKVLGYSPKLDATGIHLHRIEMPDSLLEFDVDQCPDLAPPLSVLGLFSKKGILLHGTGRLRMKESDRISEICRLVRSFKGFCEIHEDSMLIKSGGQLSNPGRLSFDDHRMIMSGIIAGIVAGFNIVHENVEKISKSYPHFLSHLKSTGITVDIDD